jgi:hypothetical protein
MVVAIVTRHGVLSEVEIASSEHVGRFVEQALASLGMSLEELRRQAAKAAGLSRWGPGDLPGKSVALRIG